MKKLLSIFLAGLLTGCASLRDTAVEYHVPEKFNESFTIPSFHKYMPSIKIGESIYVLTPGITFTSIQFEWKVKF